VKTVLAAAQLAYERWK